jgi:FtsP/CotA-like multicopper oxidase with cupredoxin domain
MTARLLALDLVAVLVVATLWVAVAAVLRTGRSRLALGLLAAAVLATAARVVLVAVLARSGWWFVQEKVLLTVPLVVVPGVAAAVLAARALLGGRRPGRFAVASAAAAAGGAAMGVLGTFVVGYPVSTAAAVLLPLLVVAAAVVVLGPRVRVVGSGLVGLVLAGVVGGAWWGSRVPDRVEHTGHTGHAHHAVSVADLRGPPGEPTRRFTLTARQADVTLPGGRSVHAWTFDGQVPGPQLTVTQGDLVEVLLRNADIADGVTIHWHGYPVPAGEDGVAGVTQDAVPPGGSFTYRFRATEPGTYWYHAHQRSLEAVRRGLYGALVVRPPTPGPAAPAPRRDRAAAPAATPPGVDVVVPLHTMDGTLLTAPPVPDVAPRVPVRLRLINTDDRPHALVLHGTPYRLAAVDGRELAGGGPLGADTVLPLPAGGRHDLVFTQLPGPVRLAVDGRDTGVLLGRDDGRPPPVLGGRLLDVTRYAPPGPPAWGPEPRFAVDTTLVLDRTLGFVDGLPALTYPINGAVYPAVPDIVVRRGDLVRMTIVNRGSEPHPMHPHGHAVLVLARDGRPASGPLWMDSFEVGPGEVWEVALRADNPGLWMNHCHNLEHAVAGMVGHLAYEGVSTPFAVGNATGNHPE